jgi:predicted nucleotidyltransferase
LAEFPDAIVEALLRFRKTVESRYEVDAVVVFGSWARGTQHVDSDVDVMVVSPDFTRDRRVEVVEFLADASFDASPRRAVPIVALAVSRDEYRHGGATLAAVAKREGTEV